MNYYYSRIKRGYTSDQSFITFDFPDFLFRNLKARNVVIVGVNLLNKHMKGLRNHVAVDELSL